MATEDSLKELDEWLSRQRESYEAGYISAKQLNEAQVDHAAGLRGYTAQLKQSMAQLGTSAKETISTMSKGQDSSAAFGKTVESGADAVAAYTAKFGTAGKALGLFVQGLAKINTAALAQSKALFEQYQKLSQVGVAGGKAMDEVYEKMRQFGYTTDQLGSLNRVLTENSKTLGKFYGSALEGSRVMGRAAAGFAEQRESLRRMGFTVDDLNEGLAVYMRQEGAMGRLRGKTDKELTDGAIAYIKELDAMTKLTGMNRQEQADAREQALNIEAFYAGLADLDPKAQEQALEAYNIALAKGGPKMAAEFAANFNGVITGATDVFLASGGESMKYFSKEFFKNGGTAAQSMQGVANAITPATMAIMKGLAQIGGSFGPSLRSVTEFKQGVDGLAKSTKQVVKDQKNQLAGVDSATASQAATAESLLNMGQAFNDFVNIFVPVATKLNKWYTGAVELLYGLVPGSSTGGIFGFGSRGGATAPGATAPAAPVAPATGGSTGAPAAGGSTGAPAAGGSAAPGATPPAPAAPAAPAARPAPAPAVSAARPAPAPAAPAVPAAPAGGSVPTTASASMLNYIKATERFTPTAFWDYKQWTNGYGTKANYPTGGPNDPGPKETVSESEAESRFSTYINAAAQKVGNFGQSKKYKWGQPQVDALTSFIFNGGAGWLGQVTNNGNRTNPEIAGSIPLYNKAGGKELAGLTKRRQEEAAMFRNNMVSAQNGGAFSGPNSGYPAILHGDEAVIPLDNNSGNFVQMFETMASTNQRIVSLLEETLSVQASIASATQNTADSSGKMLHYAQG